MANPFEIIKKGLSAMNPLGGNAAIEPTPEQLDRFKREQKRRGKPYGASDSEDTVVTPPSKVEQKKKIIKSSEDED